MKKVYNFSPGPAMLPKAVMEKAQHELLNWDETGMSVMEVSHRGELFKKVAEQAEQDLRELMHIPDNYRVLFLQGGATSQFAMVPMNLLGKNNKADYVNSGNWAKKAIKEAEQYGDIHVAATINYDGVANIPDVSSWQLRDDAAYVHYTPNETVNGLEFHDVPDVGDVPLVADMSSTILSRPIDVSRFGLIYAGTQKNLGFAGLTIVIIREDLLQEPLSGTPSMFNYQKQAEQGSLLNTAPTFNWYVTGLVLQWIKQQGGLEEMGEHNHRKAQKLYDFIDGSEYYSNQVDPACRSWMNAVFLLKDESHNAEFLKQAADAGLLHLKGHRAVGGMRASIYNAMPESGVDALIDFMRGFEQSL